MRKPTKLLCKAEVLERTGASAASIYLWMRAGKFPRARRDPSGNVCWIEAEVEEWTKKRPVAPLKGHAGGELAHPASAPKEKVTYSEAV